MALAALPILIADGCPLTSREQECVEATRAMYATLQREKNRTAESEASEAALVIALQNVTRFMQSLPKRPKVADYKKLVEQMSAEIETALSEKDEEE